MGSRRHSSKKITSPDDNGWPIPFSGGKRIGVGLRSKTTVCLERLLGVKKAPEEPEEDVDAAESKTAGSIGATSPSPAPLSSLEAPLLTLDI